MSEPFPFAERTGWSLESNSLGTALEELRRRKIEILDLTESNPTRCGFQYPQKDILTPLSEDRNLLYDPQPAGMLSARQAVAEYYRKNGFEIDPQRILLTASTSEAYSVLFRLLLNPDEGILAPRPSYPLFQYLAEINDVRMDLYPLVYEKEGWRIDLKALEESVQSDTKAIVLVNPNNPTGSFVQADELAAINALCAKKNIAIICDEVFWDYPFEEKAKLLSLAGNSKALTFTLGGLAKCLGLPQMKLSWIAASGPEKVVEEAMGRLDVILDTYLSVNTPVQNALPQWLKLQPQMRQEIRKRLQINRECITKALAAQKACEHLASQGGWYAILRLPAAHSEEEWALRLLQEDHVFVHPGYFFDFEEGTHIVLSLLPRPEVFSEGLSRILRRMGA